VNTVTACVTHYDDDRGRRGSERHQFRSDGETTVGWPASDCCSVPRGFMQLVRPVAAYHDAEMGRRGSPRALSAGAGIDLRCLRSRAPTSNPTLPLTGRRRAQRDGYPTAPPLGAPVERLVRRLHAKHHDRYSVRRRHAPGVTTALVCDSEGKESPATARPLFSAQPRYPFEYHYWLVHPLTWVSGTTSPRESANGDFDYHLSSRSATSVEAWVSGGRGVTTT
jgi:hypothetical protein